MNPQMKRMLIYVDASVVGGCEDTVSWMRNRRTQIDEEDRSLTWEQKRQRTHEKACQDPVLAPLCNEVVEPQAKPSER